MIFGTDGIRAKVGDAPLDITTISKLSAVLARELPAGATVVLGGDTRESCSTIRQWVTAYLGDFQLLDLGVVPTPVVAFETRARAAELGIMITASHNPACDNGLKFFTRDGLKLTYDVACKWSELVEKDFPLPTPHPPKITTVTADHYRTFILEQFTAADFGGMKLAFDLAHGAGTVLVPQLLQKLGIDAELIGNNPDGKNINDGVGALYPDELSGLVEQFGLHVGFALDGDADRLIVTAPNEVHGDVVLYALYRNLIAEGFWPDAVVGTIMCGMGLEKALAALKVTLVRTAVGDQNVLAEMVKEGHLLGGEPSGHIIQADLFPAGDGFLGALRLARALRRNPNLLRESRAAIVQYPTYEKAYKVRHMPPLESITPVKDALTHLNGLLEGVGRTIVRYSGTEPKLRVYVEAPELYSYQNAITALETAIAETLT